MRFQLVFREKLNFTNFFQLKLFFVGFWLSVKRSKKVFSVKINHLLFNFSLKFFKDFRRNLKPHFLIFVSIFVANLFSHQQHIVHHYNCCMSHGHMLHRGIFPQSFKQSFISCYCFVFKLTLNKSCNHIHLSSLFQRILNIFLHSKKFPSIFQIMSFGERENLSPIST